MNESLVKAAHSLNFARDDLLEALHEAGAVEALFITQVIGEVTAALAHVDALRAAIGETA